MINTHRRSMFRIVVVVLIATFAAGGAYLIRTLQLPDPTTTDRDGLMRWLVTANLSEHPDETQLVLVHRLEDLLTDESDLGDSVGELDNQQIFQLEANIGLLKEVWFRESVLGYYEVLDTFRAAYLDNKLRTVWTWADIDKQIGRAAASNNETDGDRETDNHMGTLFKTINGWIANTAQQDRSKTRRVVKAALARWLATTDLHDENEQTNTRLAMLLEEEMRGGVNLDYSTVGYSEKDYQTLWNNTLVLAEHWFIEKASGFGKCPLSQRADFVKRQIDYILSTKIMEQLPADKTTSSTNRNGELLAKLTTIHNRITDPEKRDTVHQFAKMFLSQILVRQFGRVTN